MELKEAEQLVMEQGLKEFEEKDFEQPELKEALNILIENGYKVLKINDKITFK